MPLLSEVYFSTVRTSSRFAVTDLRITFTCGFSPDFLFKALTKRVVSVVTSGSTCFARLTCASSSAFCWATLIFADDPTPVQQKTLF